MKIVLDTNVIESDPSLRSPRFQLLLRHAEAIGARFSMPRIVIEELPAVRRRQLLGLVRKFREASKNLSDSLLTQAVPSLEIDTELVVEEFVRHVHAVLAIQKSDIADYREGYLSEVLNRAIHRIPPCSPQGEEIRDAVLWLTVLDVAASELDRKVLFISQDKAFHGGQCGLRPELAEEGRARGIEIEYYKDLSLFAEHYKLSKAQLFISKDWINRAVPVSDVLNLSNESISAK